MDRAHKIDMARATRLTRLGRLDDAMAILRGEAVPGEAVGTPSPFQVAPKSSVIDLKPPATLGGVWTTLLDSTSQRPSSSSQERPAAKVQAFWADSAQTNKAGVATPTGARFDEALFVGPEGQCAYKLYVPSRYGGQSIPLIIMLHGCTQSPDDFAAGTGMNALAEEQVFLVAYPAQRSSANASKCWNWFQDAHQRRGGGEPALIAGLTRQIMTEFKVDADRVYVAGLSAGGAAAAIMGTAYPDLYAAIGVHSGLACGAAKDMPSAFVAMSRGSLASTPRGPSDAILPTIVFHGDADHTVNAVNPHQIIMQSKAGASLQMSIIEGASAGGVAFQQIVYADDQHKPQLEQWVLRGAGHAWAGGSLAGSYTDPRGPNASREMVRFFFQHRLGRDG